MILLVKQNGLYDIEYKQRLHKDLTKFQVADFFKSFGFEKKEVELIDETMNCHFFGNLYNIYMYSKNESDDYLVSKNNERNSQ